MQNSFSSFLLSIIIIITILCISCAKLSKNEQQVVAVSTTTPVDYKDASDILEKAIYLGKVSLIKVDKPNDFIQGAEVFCNGDIWPYFIKDNQINIYFADSYFGKERQTHCGFKVKRDGKDVVLYNLAIKKYEYPLEYLTVSDKKVSLSKKDLARYKKERKILDTLYLKSSKVPLFNDSFIKPLDSKITSFYGVRRIFNKKRETQHLGVDFRAPIGTPIPASNDGKVVLVMDLFFSGKTVIVDHGLSIFSMYAHLSKMSVKVGQKIEKGDIVGLSGMTGRVSGPHLHWGVKIAGNWIDGLSLVEAGY